MRKFIVKTIIMIIPIICVILYYSIEIEPHRHGDLGRLGFIAFDDEYDSLLYKSTMDSLYVIDIEDMDQIQTDSAILTLGDSFSQLGKGGYQNYLSTLYPGWKIYNMKPKNGLDKNYQMLVDMLSKEDNVVPKIIILESVERHLLGRLSNLIFYARPTELVIPEDLEETMVDTISGLKNQIRKTELYKMVIRMKGCKEELKTSILNTQEYVKKYLDINNPVKHLHLKQNLFSCKGRESDLFFYYEDVNVSTLENNPESLNKLDTLLYLTEKKGIKFLFLIASDKYDLYKDFTVKDKYSVIGQLDYFQKYNNDNRFLNTKELLYPHINNGEKDIYKCNDTHWSSRASYYVANEIKKRIDAQENK